MLIVPQASSVPEQSGKSSAEFWAKSGVRSVDVLKLDDPKAAAEQVDSADLIWMGGGDQSRLTKALAGTGVPEAIRKRYADGAVVGGTSAGAAVLSSVMITGEAYDLTTLKPNGTQTAAGLGLWPGAIVDQHFIKRQRLPRLLSAVLDKPELVGIGVDESTGALLSGTKIEVIGASQVIVIDARQAKVQPRKCAAVGIRFSVLTPGMSLDLADPDATPVHRVERRSQR
jgi:cyanophycinase